MSSEIKVDTISENTSANGVAIDSLGIKDGKITNLMNATLNAADLGSGVHIKSADSGASVNANRDDLVVENSGHCGISILAGTSSHAGIGFGDSGGNLQGLITYNHSNDEFEVNVNSSSHVFTVRSSGLAIGGTGDANTLGDYEEGTWTPAIANVTTSAVTGKYTKIGRHVSLHLYMAISGGTLDTTAIHITGVPFANGNHEAIGSIMYNQLDHGADYQVMPYFNQGSSSIRFYQSKDATGWSSLATNTLSSSTSFFISLVYES